MDGLVYYHLILIGLLLIAADAVISSYYLMWIGAGVVTVGLVDFVSPIEDIYIKISLSLILGLIYVIIAVMLKKKTPNETIDNLIQQGEIRNGKIFLDGTSWTPEFDITEYKENEKLSVFIRDNKAFLA